MKITKKQLKRIIKEEKRRLLREAAPAGSPPGHQISEQLGVLHNAINVLWELMGPEELAAELEGIAEEMRGVASGAQEW